MKRRTRWSVVMPAASLAAGLAILSVWIRPPAAAPITLSPTMVLVQTTRRGMRVIPFDSADQALSDQEGGRRVPDSWQRHDFNGAEFYVIPLG